MDGIRTDSAIRHGGERRFDHVSDVGRFDATGCVTAVLHVGRGVTGIAGTTNTAG
jgi:hypothetical protein